MQVKRRAFITLFRAKARIKEPAPKPRIPQRERVRFFPWRGDGLNGLIIATANIVLVLNKQVSIVKESRLAFSQQTCGRG